MVKSKKRALITGITGQDGAYLSEFLINKEYTVIGTSRDHLANSFNGLDFLNIKPIASQKSST